MHVRDFLLLNNTNSNPISRTVCQNRTVLTIDQDYQRIRSQKSLRISPYILLQDALLSQRDRAAGCVIVLAKSGRLELGDNILRTL